MNLNEVSKYIALILRHKPEVVGITLDEHGWANVEDLIRGINNTTPFTLDELDTIVLTDQKQRYSFNKDRTLIRANQGHSIPVDVDLMEVPPPVYLFHGTGEKYVSSINKLGIIPKSRLYVHLSADYDTAEQVGSRHGNPVVYMVHVRKMEEDGYTFFKSINNVWLTKIVPPKYIDLCESHTYAD